MYHWQKLVKYLDDQPERKATLRQIHEDCWVQNVPDAASGARKNGYHIETLHDPDNPKIGIYRLLSMVKYDEDGVPVKKNTPYDFRAVSSHLKAKATPNRIKESPRFGMQYCDIHGINHAFDTRCPGCL